MDASATAAVAITDKARMNSFSENKMVSRIRLKGFLLRRAIFYGLF
jgi:hypothetical protein